MTGTIAPYVCGENIRVDDDFRTVKVKHGNETLHLNMIQWTKEPLSPSNPYFQVELLEEIASTQICMIGINPKTDKSPASWDKHRSCRYNSNDGGVFTDGKGKKTFRPYGHKGDIILIYVEVVAPEKCLLNFYMNAQFVYRQWVLDPLENIHPAIGISNGPAEFRVTWPGMGQPLNIDLSKVSQWLGHPALRKDDRSNIVSCIEHIPAAILSIQAPRPLSRDHPFFEIELLASVNPDACPAIGLTAAVSDRLMSYPGGNYDTVGYHSDGFVYLNDDETYERFKRTEDSKIHVGDKMGCGIIFGPEEIKGCQTSGLVIVYFTKNGQIICSKSRLIPVGGFYPTVTLPEKGDKATVFYPSPSINVHSDLYTELERWRPLYAAFRFSETVEFVDYKDIGLFGGVEVRGNKDVPQILQYRKENKNGFYFHFRIISIGLKTEFKIGAADENISTETEELPHDSIDKAFTINGTWDEVVRVGDKVEVFLDTIDPGRIWQTVVVDGTIVFKEEIYFDSTAVIFPTMTFKNGPIKLQVTWPDTVNEEERTLFNLDSISQWRRSKDIKVNSTQISCTSLPDKASSCNIISPIPVGKQGAFYFEIKVKHPIGGSSLIFPGIGVSSGIIPEQTKTLTLLKQASSAFFYGTTQSLVTWKEIPPFPYQGTKEADVKRDDVSVVGCSVTYVNDIYVLTFHCDQQTRLSHRMKAPIGGLFPAISFQTGTQGQVFEVDILDTETLAKTIVGEVPNVVDITELDWKAHADAVVSALPGYEVNTDERLSSLNSVFISHDSSDTRYVEKVVTGLQSKGYKIQSTTSYMGTRRKHVVMDLSSAVIVFLSPAAINNKVMQEELRHVTSKGIPILPICMGCVTWPPGGALREDLALFDKYTGVKLTLPDELTQDHINTIEHHLSLAAGLGMQPVTVRPLSSVYVEVHQSDLDTTDDEEAEDTDDDDEVPSPSDYYTENDTSSGFFTRGRKKQKSTQTSKSSTCLIA